MNAKKTGSFIKENKKVIIACIIGATITLVINNIFPIGKFLFKTVTVNTSINNRVDSTSTAIVKMGNLIDNKVDVEEFKTFAFDTKQEMEKKVNKDFVELGFKALADKIDLLSNFLFKSAKLRDNQTLQQVKEYEQDRKLWYDMQKKVTKQIYDRDSINLTNNK